MAQRALFDTSVLIAAEDGRPLGREVAEYDVALSVVTLAELTAGVLAATSLEVRSTRLATLDRVSDVQVLPIDETAATAWAELRVHLAQHGGRVNVNDLWIAATAVAHRLPLLTQDADFDPLVGVMGLVVVRV
jgi:hypothetical protein